jgi:hypothetical protein
MRLRIERWIVGGVGVCLLGFALWLMIRPALVPNPVESSSTPEVSEVRIGGNERGETGPETPRLDEDVSRPSTRSSARERDPWYELRRSFRVQVNQLGQPGDPDHELVLEGYRIHTASGYRVTLAEDDGEQAYFVQFDGPIRREWRERVEQVGGRIGGYIPQFALTVIMDGRTAERLGRETSIRWIHPVRPEYKLQPFLAHLAAIPPGAVPETIDVTIAAVEPGRAGELAEVLSEQPVTVHHVEEGRRLGWVRATVPRARLPDLAGLSVVQWIEEYVAPGFCMIPRCRRRG